MVTPRSTWDNLDQATTTLASRMFSPSARQGLVATSTRWRRARRGHHLELRTAAHTAGHPAFHAGALKSPAAILAGVREPGGGGPHEPNYWAKMILERGTGLEPATLRLRSGQAILLGRNRVPLPQQFAAMVPRFKVGVKPGCRRLQSFLRGWMAV